jgi:methyltransferase
MTPLAWLLGFVTLQRLAELMLARRNTRRLLAMGAREAGAGHYPLFFLLHGSWLLALALVVPWQADPAWPLVAAFFLLQAMRIWVVASLGRFWTTRIITLETAPLRRRGPYRWMNHPNYWVVVGEIAVLPLAFGAWHVALIWSVLNALLLHHRIRVEDAALAPRRRHALSGQSQDVPAMPDARSGGSGPMDAGSSQQDTSLRSI